MKYQKNLLVITILSTLMSPVSLFAQNTLDSLNSLETLHRVVSIAFEVDGNTRERALARFVDLAEGDEFSNEEELRTYVERERQDLVNYRVFEYVEAILEPASANLSNNGIQAWNVTFRVKDKWSLIPFPYPKYDSNTGFRIGVKTYYDNAFGTMTDAYLGMNMDIRTNDDTGSLEVGEWTINPAWSRIKIGRLYFSVNYLQAFNESEYYSDDPATDYAYSYYQSQLSFGSTIDLPGDWSYSFSPNFDFRYSYEDLLGNGNYREQPVSFSWSHNGRWGRVDWLENFRKGQMYTLSHSFRFGVQPDTLETYIINEIGFNASWYLPFAKIFNYYSRFGTFYVFNDIRSGVGSLLRGIANNSMSGNAGVVINNTLGIQFWRLEGVWDAQVHPFFDIGFTSSPDSLFDPSEDIRYSMGLGFVLYLDIIPNLVARGTIAADLGRYAWSDWDKYELIITSSLSY